MVLPDMHPRAGLVALVTAMAGGHSTHTPLAHRAKRGSVRLDICEGLSSSEEEGSCMESTCVEYKWHPMDTFMYNIMEDMHVCYYVMDRDCILVWM